MEHDFYILRRAGVKTKASDASMKPLIEKMNDFNIDADIFLMADSVHAQTQFSQLTIPTLEESTIDRKGPPLPELDIFLSVQSTNPY